MKKFSFTKHAGKLVAVASTAMMAAPAFAASEISTALTENIDKADLLAGGVIILGACAVIALIGLGRRLAK